jgi:DNA invertase Pin-like site-specific DNA recombinase
MPTDACKLAISYIRFSTTAQDLGDSKRRQLEDTTAPFCQRHGLYLDPTYSFEDLGVSGFLGKNARSGELSDFLELLRAGRIPKGATLVIESLDRLGRDRWRPTYKRIEEILEAGVRIGNVNRDKILDADSLNDPLVIMELLFETMRSFDESKLKSERGKSAWAQRHKKMEQGVPVTHNCAPWLQPNADRTGWIRREDRIQLLLRMVAECLNGTPLASIAVRLNAENVPTWGRGSKPKVRAKCWKKSWIRALLSDRRLIGEVQCTTRQGDKKVPRQIIPNYYPPILTEDEFAKVQLSLRQRSHKAGRSERQDRVNLFRGLLWSSNAETNGKPIGFEATVCCGRKVPRKRTSLVCRVGDGTHRWHTSFHYGNFESAFLTFVRELKPSDFTGKPDPLADRLASLSGQMTLLSDKIEATREAIKGASTASAIKPLLGVLSDLETERDGIKAAYDEASVRAKSPVIEAMADAQSLIDLLEASEDPGALRRRIRSRLRQLVEKITLSVFDHNRCRYGFVTVTFHDGSQREFWTCYSMTPRPIRRGGEIPQELVGNRKGIVVFH